MTFHNDLSSVLLLKMSFLFHCHGGANQCNRRAYLSGQTRTSGHAQISQARALARAERFEESQRACERALAGLTGIHDAYPRKAELMLDLLLEGLEFLLVQIGDAPAARRVLDQVMATPVPISADAIRRRHEVSGNVARAAAQRGGEVRLALTAARH